MDNIKTEQLPNGCIKLTPQDGYLLYNKVSQQYYSEAIVREITDVFVAVENG